MSKVTCFFAAIVLVVGISPVCAEAQGQIVVTGEGSVFAVPDMAVINMGASAEADTAKDAMDQTSDITAAILDRLTEAGVVARDIQTSDLNLSPVWSNRSSANTRPTIDGYRASNRVTVRVRDLDALGRVLDAVLTDGANELGGLQFKVSNPAPLMNEARVRAVADARAKAELYADAAKVTLGPLISLNETGARAPQPQLTNMARMSDESVPVAQGETELRASVTLVYQIQSE
ncbi:SIMPL domain-containing protein [Marivita sp.]|uniref:SIMPL domain-containing protein n=1 Tax=Marivita sp. TaxID=2003365 RepID=UPI003F6C1F17